MIILLSAICVAIVACIAFLIATYFWEDNENNGNAH